MKTNKLFFRSIAVICFIVVNFSHLFGAWDIEYLPSENKSEGLNILQNETWISKEKKVLEYIKNSWCSKEKAELIMQLVIVERPQTCVEIGAFSGSCTLPMLVALKHMKHGTAIVIDAWSNKEAVKGLDSNDPNTSWWNSVDLKSVKRSFLSMIHTWNLASYCKIIPTSSEMAASKIDSIDFLHLDGNFSEQGALLDTNLYLPKVKSGGYVLLSNVLIMVSGKPTKMKALWPIFDQCDIIAEIENGNAILFKKR
jgi:hypothetical protein